MNEKNREKIEALKSSRGQIDEYLKNFICNFARAAMLMHSMKLFREKSHLVQEAIRNYIISIASLLETFYRDLFIYVLEKDQKILHTVLQAVKEKPNLAEVFMLAQRKISFAEVTASCFKFQSIQEIDKSFQKIFQPKGYLKTLHTYEHICSVPAKGYTHTKMKLPQNWKKDFEKIFLDRHRFVHDANYECTTPLQKILHLEVLALQITQFTSAIISKKYGNPLFYINNQKAFFVIEDLISDDYIILDDADKKDINSHIRFGKQPN